MGIRVRGAGSPCRFAMRYAAIKLAADNAGAAVVEDAAHALGANTPMASESDHARIR